MQTSYSRTSEIAKPGLIAQEFGTRNVISKTNRTLSKNVWSYTVASDAETTTIVTLPDDNATQITVTTAAQGSAALTAAQHTEDLNDSDLKLWMTATVSTATITLTGVRAGWEFEVAGTNIGTPSEDTEASQSEAIPFGAAVALTSTGGVKVVDTVSTKGIVTVTIDTADDSTAYALSVNGSAISYTSGTGATTTTIRDGLIDEINRTYALAGVVKAYAKDANELYIEAIELGDSVTVTESDDNLSIVTTGATGVSGDNAIGVAVRNLSVENDILFTTNSKDEYPASGKIQVSVLDEGSIWMKAKGTVTAGTAARASIATDYEGFATAETTDSVPFLGTAIFDTAAADGELVRVRIK